MRWISAALRVQPEANVVREDRRPQHITVTMNRIDPVEQRDAQSRFQRMLLKVVVHVGPGFQTVAVIGIGVAAIQNRAQKKILDVAEILNVLLVGLSHLADLFVLGSCEPKAPTGLRIEKRRESHRNRRDQGSGHDQADEQKSEGTHRN